MIRKLGSVVAAGVLSIGMSMASHAAFISGTVGFSGTIDATTLSDIVLPITLFTPEGGLAAAGGGTGDFAGIVFPTAATANPFDITAIGGTIYEVAGFSFEVDTVGFAGGTPFTCIGGLCEDSISLVLAGTVSAAGFDDTAWIGNFTANGTCLLDGVTCAEGSRAGSWSSTIAALEVPPEPPVDVPAPATLLLLGLGLAGLGASRRRV